MTERLSQLEYLAQTVELLQKQVETLTRQLEKARKALEEIRSETVTVLPRTRAEQALADMKVE